MSIKIDLEKCCYKCEYPRLEMEESNLISFGETTNVIIKCSNAKICKYLEQLKEQNNQIIKDLAPKGCADMPKEIVCNCTKERNK